MYKHWMLLAVVLCCSLTALDAGLPDVEVCMHAGRPLVFVDGKPQPLPGYSVRYWLKADAVVEIPRFAKHHMGVYFIGPPTIPGDYSATQFWIGDQISNKPLAAVPAPRFASIDEQATFISAQDPGAYYLIRFSIYEPASWSKAHQDQFVVDEDGKVSNAPSLASDLYWDAAARYSQALVEYCEGQPFAARVLGYANFHREEGIHSPVGLGVLFDHNPLMLARWRTFLHARYGTVERLREAYQDQTLTFATVDIPRDKLRGSAPQVSNLLYWQAAKDNQPLRDYLEMTRDIFHQRFQQLSAAMLAGVKRKVLILHDALKQPMQGWNLLDFFAGNTSQALAEPELMAGSGSMDAAELFDTPGFSGLITPHDYQARGIGGVFEPEGIADSVVLHGKTFFTEMDTRTYADEHNGYGKARNDQEFAAITWRNLATSLTRGFYFYWMDLSSDWFATPSIHKVIDRQVKVLKESVDWPHETVPGIAVILDDRAVLETNGTGNYLNEAVMWEVKQGLAHCGVPYRIYLLQDLALPNFPKHRVFYFPNLFKVDDTRLALLKQKVFRDGNVVVWGPGSGISNGETISAASAQRLTGFTFEMPFMANFARRTQISNFDHPITRALAADTIIGGPLPYGPMLFPLDGTPLGLALTKQGRDARGLVVKEFGKGPRGAYKKAAPLEIGDYASVFTTAVPLPADLWRGLARYAGAHIYTESNDLIMADSSIVAIHSLKSGAKRIALPGEFAISDVITGQALSRRTREITFTMRAPETRVFRLVAVAR